MAAEELDEALDGHQHTIHALGVDVRDIIHSDVALSLRHLRWLLRRAPVLGCNVPQDHSQRTGKQAGQRQWCEDERRTHGGVAQSRPVHIRLDAVGAHREYELTLIVRTQAKNF